MIERLDLIEKRYHEIQELLMQPDVLNDIKKSKDLSIELSSIEDTVNCYNKYKNVLTDLKEAHEMLKREPIDCNPTIWLNPEKENFYDFTTDDFRVDNYVTGPQIKNIPIAVWGGTDDEFNCCCW